MNIFNIFYNIYSDRSKLDSIIEDLNEGCVKILRPYHLYFMRNKPSKKVTVRSGRFIVLNDSASLKMVIKL